MPWHEQILGLTKMRMLDTELPLSARMVPRLPAPEELNKHMEELEL